MKAICVTNGASGIVTITVGWLQARDTRLLSYARQAFIGRRGLCWQVLGLGGEAPATRFLEEPCLQRPFFWGSRRQLCEAWPYLLMAR